MSVSHCKVAVLMEYPESDSDSTGSALKNVLVCLCVSTNGAPQLTDKVIKSTPGNQES